MRRIIKSITLLAIMAIALPSFGQGLKAFKLKNGLPYMYGKTTRNRMCTVLWPAEQVQ